jgi:hypothetical protein
MPLANPYAIPDRTNYSRIHIFVSGSFDSASVLITIEELGIKPTIFDSSVMSIKNVSTLPILLFPHLLLLPALLSS